MKLLDVVTLSGTIVDINGKYATVELGAESGAPELIFVPLAWLAVASEQSQQAEQPVRPPNHGAAQ